MKIGVTVAGPTPVKVPLDKTDGIATGVRLLARADNSGKVFIGTSSAVTPATGNLIPKGDPGNTNPYTATARHLKNYGELWVVADGPNQTVDWAAD